MEIVVIKYLNVEFIDVYSVVIEVFVKYVDRKWKSIVVVESIWNECFVINFICVKLSVLRCVIVRSINVEESVVLEIVYFVIKIVDGF